MADTEAILLADAFAGVSRELAAQEAKWGDQLENTLLKWAVILGEEYGETCEAILDEDLEHVAEEATQVAAVALRVVLAARRAGV